VVAERVEEGVGRGVEVEDLPAGRDQREDAGAVVSPVATTAASGPDSSRIRPARRAARSGASKTFSISE